MNAPLRAVGVVVLAALIAGGCGSSDADLTASPTASPTTAPTTADTDPAATEDPLAGVVRFDGLSRDHEQGDLSYPQNPPVGGTHNPLWHACGLYTVEVPEERAVHSLEHGAVWIAYEPGTNVDALVERVAEESHILVSPVVDMAAPIVLNGWGVQLELDSLDLDTIDAFIAAFIRQGPEGPTPCRQGGVGAEPDQSGPDLDF